VLGRLSVAAEFGAAGRGDGTDGGCEIGCSTGNGSKLGKSGGNLHQVGGVRIQVLSIFLPDTVYTIH